MTSDYLEFLNTRPDIHPSVFIGRGAQIMGDVRIHKDASIWYNAVLRGDIDYIEIGERSNIQDGSILHVEHSGPCIIGKDVVVGHHVNLHGCIIEDGCLIGMGAIILSGAVIKKGSIIAAGALIKEKAVVEPGSLMAGIPAKKVRTDEGFMERTLHHASEYVKIAAVHKQKGLGLDPLQFDK